MPRRLLRRWRRTCNRSPLAGSSREYPSTIPIPPTILSRHSAPASGASPSARASSQWHSKVARSSYRLSNASRSAHRQASSRSPTTRAITKQWRAFARRAAFGVVHSIRRSASCFVVSCVGLTGLRSCTRNGKGGFPEPPFFWRAIGTSTRRASSDDP